METMNGYEDPAQNGGVAMNEDQFQQESEFRHDSFAAPPRSADANKWDEEEDWEVQQREDGKDGWAWKGQRFLETLFQISEL